MLWGFAADPSSQSHYSQFISQWKRFAFIDIYQNIANRFVDAAIGDVSTIERCSFLNPDHG